MIDNGCTGYSFIDTNIAHDVCDALGMSFVELLKLRRVKGYDGRMDESITSCDLPLDDYQGSYSELDTAADH